MHQSDNHERYIDYLVKAAAENVCDGIIEEPRLYWDFFDLGASQLAVRNHADAFVNGEKFPVRLTHLLAAVRPGFDDSPITGLTETDIQRMGLRLIFHDQFYMSDRHMALPAWRNTVTSPSPPSDRATSSLTLDRPVILSSRDSLAISVWLEDTPSSARLVSVSLTGTGLVSKRPYFFSGELEVSDTQKHLLDPRDFRNDGTEPVAITDMVLHCGAESGASSGAGDIRYLRVNVRHLGNGTQDDWVVTSTATTVPSGAPAVLWGKTAGRAIVHRFPGDGIFLEPGDGIDAEALALNTDVNNLQLVIGLMGYLAVT